MANSRRGKTIRKSKKNHPSGLPYCLFSTMYTGGYFGAKQAVDIDSLRYSFDRLREEKVISQDQQRWFLVALCKAMFPVAFTTGHFAQYLDVKSSTLSRFLAVRRRDVVAEWVSALAELQPVGSRSWRAKNKVFNTEAVKLLRLLKTRKKVPSVVYADPPYSADHYSRYYHLLETLIAYDYPDVSGKGQYRPDRFVSEFSLQSKVANAFDGLAQSASELGADFVLNYPENGLLRDARESVLTILQKYFRYVEVAAAVPHRHSTLGASNGIEKAPVTELIFYAR
jgi:adenine-specific DNA-methyltransferase